MNKIQTVQCFPSAAIMAATMLAGHPQALTSPTGSWEQEQHLMAHLSPNSRYEVKKWNNNTKAVYYA